MKLKFIVFLVVISFLTFSCATIQKQQPSEARKVEIALIKYEMARNIILHKDYKNLPKAFSYLDSAKKVLKKDPRVYYMLAIAYQMRGDMKNYERYLKKSIKIDPNFFDAYNALGIYYFKIGKYDKSVKTFTKLINNPLYPHADIAFYNRALVYINLKKFKKAEEDLINALIFSNYSNPIYAKTLLNTQILKRQYLKALQTISIMEKHWGTTCFTSIKKALCIWKIGNKKEALRIIKSIKASSQKCSQEKNALLKEIENDNNINH